MRNVKKYLHLFAASSMLGLCSQAMAAQTTTFVFDHFTTDSLEQCKTMGLEQNAKQIQMTVDLSQIQTTTKGVPAILSSSGVSLNEIPSFFFMGLKDKYAYMARPTDAMVQDKPFYALNFSMVSKNQYTDYQGALRLNDAEGNRCMIVLKQS